VRSSAPPLVGTTSVDDTSPIFFNLDPFRSEFVLENDRFDLSTPDITDRFPSSGRPPSPAPSAANTAKDSGRRSSLKRLKTLTKEALRNSLRTPVSELSSPHSVKARRARSLRSASDTIPTTEPPFPRSSPKQISALILDNFELTASPSPELQLPLHPILLRRFSEESAPAPEEVSIEPERQLVVPSHNQIFAPAFLLPPPPVRYEFVDPSDLTASPFSFTNSLLNASTRTSFIPPSPSWLSRNVQVDEQFDFLSILPSPTSQARTSYLFDLERLRPSPVDSEPSSPCVLFRPDSPPPLPIPPPIIISPPQLPAQTHSIVIENSGRDSDAASVSESTLTTESCPASLLTSSSRTVPISTRASISSPTLSQNLSHSLSNKRSSFARNHRSAIEGKRKSRSIVTHSFRSSFGKENRSSFVSFSKVRSTSPLSCVPLTPPQDSPGAQGLKPPTLSTEARNSNCSTTAIFNLEHFSDLQ
jgi:hypothetical protein